jgi:hypothetical protein
MGATRSADEPVDEPVAVVVSVSDDHVHRIGDLTERLRASGLRVERVLETLGTVTGLIPRSKIADIERLDGVSSVEQERTIQLPPPDSPVQ